MKPIWLSEGIEDWGLDWRFAAFAGIGQGLLTGISFSNKSNSSR